MKNSPVAKKNKKRYNERHHDKIVAYRERYRKENPEKVKASRSTPKQIAARRAYFRSVLPKLRRSLWSMTKGEHDNPVSLVELGCFSDNDDVRRHFESTFEPWMTFENNGKHAAGNDYNVRWNIGHRLPMRIFDPTNVEDRKRCFDRRNLYAQCARENLEQLAHLHLSDAELESLRPVWPAKANGDLAALKRLFE